MYPGNLEKTYRKSSHRRNKLTNPKLFKIACDTAILSLPAEQTDHKFRKPAERWSTNMFCPAILLFLALKKCISYFWIIHLTTGNSNMNLASAADSVFIGELTEITLANLGDETFGVEQLVEKTGLSHFVVRHRIKSITQKTISQFMVEIRLQKAMEILRNEAVTSSEVAYRVGFGSPNYFNKCFHEFYGYPPGEVRKRTGAGSEDKLQEFVVPFQQTTINHLTEPRQEKRWLRTVLFISGVMIALVCLAYVFSFFLLNPGNTKGKPPESRKKSIAVLPFLNDSRDSANIPFINGMMEGILDNLQIIKELKVVSRTSVEQYRNNINKTIPQIAKELGVNYIVEGSGQKYGDQLILTVQLIEAGSDRQLFSERYNRKWEDIFAVQSEISTLVARKIEAAITPEEAELIEKRPTANMAALNLYLQGMELSKIYVIDKTLDLMPQAEVFYRKAVSLDSTYADAYVGLGWCFNHRKNSDSALYFANRALHFDNKNPEAYLLKGNTLFWNVPGMQNEGENAYKLAIKYNPNSFMGYHFMSSILWEKGESLLSVEYKLKALDLGKDPYSRKIVLPALCNYLEDLGLFDLESKFIEEMISYNNDSTFYYKRLIAKNMYIGDYLSAYKYALKSEKWISKINPLALANICLYIKDYTGALKSVEELINMQEKRGIKISPNSLIGYVLLKNGLKEESDKHFEGVIRNSLKNIEVQQPDPGYRDYLILAWVYSARGEKEKAMENLRKAANCKDIAKGSIYITRTYNHPALDAFRNEPEFQELIRSAEERFIIEKKNIEKLLKEEGFSE